MANERSTNDQFNNDWMIIDNISITNISKIVKQGIKTTSSISLDSKSSRGDNVKQYDLFEYLNNNPAIDKIKEKILLNLDRHLHLKLNTLKLLSAWTVLGYKNSYHELHKHNKKQNHVSSVLYLNVKEGGIFYYVYKKNEEIEYGSYKPQVGDLITFPVWLWHGSYPQSQGLRQTLNLDFEICQ